jgi:hypothetical protein
MLNAARFQFVPVPVSENFPELPWQNIKTAHTDLWPLYPSPEAARLRAWLNAPLPGNNE